MCNINESTATQGMMGLGKKSSRKTVFLLLCEFRNNLIIVLLLKV